MPSFLDSLTQAFTPDVTKNIGETTRLDPELVTKGLAVVGPLVLGAMAKRAATPEGLDGLNRLLPPNLGADLGNVLGIVAATSVLTGLFGTGYGAIGSTLDRRLGFKVSSLIPLITPVALAYIARRKAAEKLEPEALANTLEEEHQALLATDGETLSLVRSALEAGDQASDLKGRFSPDEWTRIRLAPAAAARMVIQASPSSAIGVAKELDAAAKAISTATEIAEPASLIGLAFDTDISKDEVTAIESDRASTVQIIKDAIGAVSHNIPAELPGYAQFVHNVATKVAEETKEGGFLGIGGTRISKEEQAVLDEIDHLMTAIA